MLAWIFLPLFYSIRLETHSNVDNFTKKSIRKYLFAEFFNFFFSEKLEFPITMTILLQKDENEFSQNSLNGENNLLVNKFRI